MLRRPGKNIWSRRRWANVIADDDSESVLETRRWLCASEGSSSGALPALLLAHERSRSCGRQSARARRANTHAETMPPHAPEPEAKKRG
eukprot:6184860-Pleurochrysis_carterae.AAC.2